MQGPSGGGPTASEPLSVLDQDAMTVNSPSEPSLVTNVSLGSDKLWCVSFWYLLRLCPGCGVVNGDSQDTTVARR